jgi:Spy/CpxP family protein refolding chaperone
MNLFRLSALLVLAMGLITSSCGRHHGMGPYGPGGGGYAAERGVKEMASLIDRTVKDPEKAKQAKQIVEQIMAEVGQSFKQSREHHERLYALNANYRATPEEFTRILDDLNNQRMRSASMILALRFKMKDLLTPEEWKALTDEMANVRSRYRHGGPAETPGRSGT